MNRIHTKNTQNFESKLHYSPDSWVNLGVGQVDRGHLFFCDILYYFLCVTFQRRRWLYVGQLVYIDGFSNLLSVFSFQVPFQQLRFLISVSFTSCEEQVLFIYNQVSLFTEKEDDTYDIVYTLMDTAFLYQSNLHRIFCTVGNSHRCYLYRKPLDEIKTNCNCK